MQKAGRILGLDVQIEAIGNPRREAEEHYYNPVHTGLLDLGLDPHFMTDDVLVGMLNVVSEHRYQIRPEIVMPRVRWNA